MTHWDYIGLAGWSGGMGAACIVTAAIFAGVAAYNAYERPSDANGYSVTILIRFAVGLMALGLVFWMITASVILGGK
jgi:hypothetical protein